MTFYILDIKALPPHRIIRGSQREFRLFLVHKKKDVQIVCKKYRICNFISPRMRRTALCFYPIVHNMYC
jgi:hypothetical protein